MGIGGSGMSAVAQIAQAQGFQVSGCDLQTDTPYLDKVKSANIPIYSGHSPDHLHQIDLLAVTPAVFYQSNTHPEVEQARKLGILITWEDFLGTYLHPNKFLISIAGTHGKSTTTSLAGLLLEAANLDPTVEVGATVKEWHNNVRLGQGQYFVSEADEFHNNFKTFKSDIILLTLVEMDHPEFFGSIENMLSYYQQFVDRLKPGGTVIANADSPLIHKLSLPNSTIFYSLKNVQNIILSPLSTQFTYRRQKYFLKIPGIHNIQNVLGLIELGRTLHIKTSIVKQVLSTFSGIGRRIELLGQAHGIFVYDDYANHPSSFSASISAVKQLHPESKLWAVIEPHTYSRLKSLISELPYSVRQADEILVSSIFSSRESDPGNFSGQNIVDAMKHKAAHYLPNFSDIVDFLKQHVQPTDVILVMGSGNSYKLSRQILNTL